MPRFKDDAIVIRLLDWSETSQIVSLLSREHGKLPVIAKGARRQSPSMVARYSGGLELLTQGQAVGMIKATAELATLTEWDLQQPNSHLRHDLQAQWIAMYAAELVGAMVADHDPHPVSFAALVTLLQSLKNIGHKANHASALLSYQWTVLCDCGFRPVLDRDVVTDQPLGEARSYAFDALAGGLMMDRGTTLGEDTRGPWRVRSSTVELLRLLDQNQPIDHADQTGQTDRTDRTDEMNANDHARVGRANRLLGVYVRTILDRELRTIGLAMG